MRQDKEIQTEPALGSVRIQAVGETDTGRIGGRQRVEITKAWKRHNDDICLKHKQYCVQ